MRYILGTILLLFLFYGEPDLFDLLLMHAYLALGVENIVVHRLICT